MSFLPYFINLILRAQVHVCGCVSVCMSVCPCVCPSLFRLEQLLLPSLTEWSSKVILHWDIALLLNRVRTIAVLGVVLRSQALPEMVFNILGWGVWSASVSHVILDRIWFDDIPGKRRVLRLDAFYVLITQTSESVTQACLVGIPAYAAFARVLGIAAAPLAHAIPLFIWPLNEGGCLWE